MPIPHPLPNLASVAGHAAGLPKCTASLFTSYPSSDHSHSLGEELSERSAEPAQDITPESAEDFVCRPDWAKDVLLLYPDEVDATVEEFRNSTICSKSFGKANFDGLVPSYGEIGAFLRRTDLYDLETRRWRDVPEVCTDVRQLFRPMRALIDAITKHFGYVAARSVVDSFPIPADLLEFTEPHQRPESQYRTTPLKMIPHMMAHGVTGSNFGPLSEPLNSSVPSYNACISPIEFQTDAGRNFISDLTQLACYARQCFMHQHNRRFVYTLLVTESNVRLYLFDRSGVCFSHPVNIHRLASDFVRMILGVWSPNDEAVGFDTSVYWDQNDRGKWSRYINSFNEHGHYHRYSLVKNTAIYDRWFIVGRGTTCWLARGDDGEQLLIKDLWRDATSGREWEFLDAAKGLEGVGQMISAEEGVHISTLRRDSASLLADDVKPFFVDRQFNRLVLKDYGTSTIAQFEGRRDLLLGFRDAIGGHQRLWNAGVLHGDVNMDNILLSQSALPGGRGVLIDLDLSMWLVGGGNESNVEFHKMGTRAYLSVNVLESLHNPRASFSRDHLDDLESFYYLLCHICSTFTAPGEQHPKPDFVKQWEQEDTVSAAFAKMGGLLCADYEPTPYFGPTFVQLLDKLRAFFANAAGRKRRDATHREHTGEPAPIWRQLRASAAEDYMAIFSLIDDALYELEFGRFEPIHDPDLEARHWARVFSKANSLPLPDYTSSIRPLDIPRHMDIRQRGDENAVAMEDFPSPTRFKFKVPPLLKTCFQPS